MHTDRKTPGHTRTLPFLSLTAAALLAATTACGPGTDDKPATTAPPKPSAPAPTPGAASGAPSPPATSPVPRPGEAEGEPVGKNNNCSDEYAHVSVEWAVPPAKDDSKLLLTVVNTGPRTCLLTTYPVLRVKDGHGRLVAVFENSKPETPVVLGPGKEAYAGLLARQGGKGAGTRTTDLALAPHGQSPEEDTGEGTLLQLPSGGVYMDDQARVTYWQSTSENAASPLFNR
ncbi:DUF4232 domain-containing protein [Streptomyces sp. NRRL F-4474]|uniref:DUF4232 domain-containing protein n=1 Tax=Streptomyces sp. NRRL F-4474 TaxID=1463851 RepID=UPI00068E5109|nr:DUF4232 domain-containing protein [Streptomyces sp. NRRL F-4474]